MNSEPSGTMQINGRPIGKHRHICAFFHSKEEERRTLLDFITEGFEQGDKAEHFVAAECIDEHRTWLETAGIDVASAEQHGQLKIAAWDDTYLHEGFFDLYRQLRLLEHELVAAHHDGFDRTRVVANMEWALENKAGVDDVAEYEARLNYLLPNYPDAVVSTYDLSRFSPGVAMNVLRSHPAVVLGGVLQENTSYVPPDEFLAEWRERRMEMACP